MSEIYYDVDLIDPQFEIFKDEEGKFRFLLRTADGEVLCTSDGYTSTKECEERIETVKLIAPGAAVERV
jgi:uncharacterized protein YegP (UPF0339 family)